MKPELASQQQRQQVLKRLAKLRRDCDPAAWLSFVAAHQSAIAQQAPPSAARSPSAGPSSAWNPIVEAVQLGLETQARAWLRLADAHCPGFLRYRSPRLESLIMLAVSAGMPDLVADLARRDPSQVYRLYDTSGRNALHNCSTAAAAAATAGAERSAERCLTALLRHCFLTGGTDATGATLRGLLSAIEMPDRDGARPGDLLPRTQAGCRMRKLLSMAEAAAATAAVVVPAAA